MKKLHASKSDIERIAPQIARAFIRHTGGDPVPADACLDCTDLGLVGKIFAMLKGGLVEAWNTDLAPGKNQNMTIDLKSGTVAE
jgi:hypothetical protein